ncbi:Uncharacterised protein [Serratia fonticola]|uniref:Uncharacterized protein n=1 Tax=Serratia fonticola TaxID=47917 RepID=A0A4U9VEN4_SERFO|nr:Uncharacterised protein [Serratia fonticola]
MAWRKKWTTMRHRSALTVKNHNPWIPWREMSETPLPEQDIDLRLDKELSDALQQNKLRP